MAEPIRHMHSHRELTELLIKTHGIHEGNWAIALEFIMGATLAGPTGEEQLPTGMVSIRKVGIQEAGPNDTIAVDAAVVNPPLAIAKKRSSKTATSKIKE